MTPFDEQTVFTNKTFKNLSLPGVEIHDREFDGCTFSKCDLRSAKFVECRLRDCKFAGCEMISVGWTGTSLSEVDFNDCHMIGVNWTDSAWAKGRFLLPARFTKCALNHSLFLGLDMHEIELRDCSARETDFSEADLSKAVCAGTDFHSARFWHTNLTEADFRGATNYAIPANENTLKKTRFSLPEALALLYALDVVIDDGSEH